MSTAQRGRMPRRSLPDSSAVDPCFQASCTPLQAILRVHILRLLCAAVLCDVEGPLGQCVQTHLSSINLPGTQHEENSRNPLIAPAPAASSAGKGPQAGPPASLDACLLTFDFLLCKLHAGPGGGCQAHKLGVG